MAMTKRAQESGLFAFDFALADGPFGHDSDFLKYLPEVANY
jgi:hypothetical protein